MSIDHEMPAASIVALPRAGVPADHGLATLGLIMQLVARTTCALAALVAPLVLVDAGAGRGNWRLLALALCVARSQVHRIAGRDLVYGRDREALEGAASPLAATHAYVAVGIVQAIAIGLIAVSQLGATPRTAAGIAAALALWPIVLAVVCASRWFRSFRAGIPLGEDRGLEGASIAMTILGAGGAISTAALLVLVGRLPTRYLEHGWGTMLSIVFALLLARSCLHVYVGAAGLRATSFDRPGELADRYVCIGLVSAFAVAGVLALLALSACLPVEAIASAAVVCWLLAAWPMTVRRYFYHRQFAELLAGDRVLHRRAPDAGLTGLGWLLAGHATAVAALLIVELTVEPHGAGRAIESLVAIIAPRGPGSVDLAITGAVCALEAVAAIALIRMSDHRRAIAAGYAVIASGVAVTAAWPIIRTIGSHAMALELVLYWLPAAAQLVIPIATLVLMRRAVIPTARAIPARRTSGWPR